MWIHHGETVVVNDEDEDEYDDETLEYMFQYSAELDAWMDPEFVNEQSGDAGGWDDNDEGGANNDDRACVGDEDDLEDIIQALGPEILLKIPKGLEKFRKDEKSIEWDCVWCWKGLSDTLDIATFCAWATHPEG